MDITAAHQVLVFFAMVLCGALCGVLFDLFRGIRYRRKTRKGVVAVQDLVFWVLELFLVYAVLFSLNYAYVRAFELVALVLGSVLYFMTLSVFVVSLVSRLTQTAEKICRVIMKPVCKTAGFVKKAIKKSMDKISVFPKKFQEVLTKMNKQIKKVEK